MPGIKSATTTSSRRYRYDPGSDFSYKFVTRTFSRQGKRPATSPARIKHAAAKKQPSPEDVIALAQSPSPSLIQESYGTSLMMLRRGKEKVRPGKFLQLQKLMNQPCPEPLASSKSVISTPRMVKAMISGTRTAESSSRYSKQQCKETQYDERSQISKPSASTRSHFIGIQHSDSWETKDPQSSLSFSKIEDFPERCVRCSAFPDIQIEGHSLSRILTNTNVLMAKEHCEVLGAGSCPDCIRVRSQRQNEDHCSKNTPASANDVYKIALVHERSPHLTKREVQRKLFDGDISDRILNFPYWNQNASLPIANYEHQKEYELENYPENQFLPDIYSKDKKPKSSSKLQTQNTISFETIYEASENENESETEEKKSNANDFNASAEKTNALVFQKHSAEKLQKIQVVPAAETESAADFALDNASECVNVTYKSDSHSKSVNLKPIEKVKTSIQTDVILSPSKSLRKRIEKRCFTINVVPSNNFFFDISDLAERLRNSGIIRTKARSKNQTFQLINVHQAPIKTENSLDKIDTESNASTDSMKPIKDFNMTYEPPVFSNYKGGYLGLSSATSRTSSVF